MNNRFVLTLIVLFISISSFALGPITGVASVCVGSTTTLSNATTGGTWSSSNTAIASVGSSTGIVSGNVGGTTTITYYASATFVTQVVTVNMTPAAITGTLYACSGFSTALISSPTGGTWYSSAIPVATVSGSGVVTGLSAGTTNITYILSTGCFTNSTVTIYPTPSAIGGVTALCVGTSSTLTNSVSGGTWYSSFPGYASIDFSTGLLSGNTVGITNITYILPTGCNSSTTVTVNDIPAMITGTPNFCAGYTSALSSATTGGTWSSSNASVATINSVTGVATGTSTGTATISYILSTGCARTLTVTVSAIPTAISGTNIACLGATTTLSNGVAGGTWASSNTGIATVSPTGVVTGVSLGTVTITYGMGIGCYSTMIVSVNPYPTAITGPTSVAVGGTIPLGSTPAGGLWTSSTPSIATVSVTTGTVTGMAAGTTTVSYRVAGCAITTVIAVGSLVAPISGPSSVCAGSTTTYTAGTGGTWSSSATGVGTITPGTGVFTALAAGTTTISYNSGTDISTMTVSVNPVPAAITGMLAICNGTVTTLSSTTPGGSWSSSTIVAVISSAGVATPIIAGTTTISYTLPTGCFSTAVLTVNFAPSAVSGSSTICLGTSATFTCGTAGGVWSSSTIPVAVVSASGIVTGLGLGTSTISYTLPSGCSSSVVVTVVSVPAAITGSSSICIGSSGTLSCSTAGGTWSSSNLSVATIGLGTGAINGIALGTTIITYSLGTGCMATTVVTVVAAPAPITGPGTVCAGASIALSNTTSGGTWSSSNTSVATAGAGTGVVTGIFSGTAVISYIFSPTGCAATTVVTVMATPTPITGTLAICTGASTTLGSTPAGGTWTSSNPIVASVGAGTGIVSGVNAGTANITYTAATGCINTAVVTVYPVPAPISGTLSTCTGASTILTNSSSGGTWSSSNPGVATIGFSTGVASGISSGTSTITYSLSTGCFTTAVITVNPAPAAITGPGTVCTSTTITLGSTTGGGTWSSSSSAVAAVTPGTGVVTGISPGTATISYILSTGCFTTRIVTVNASPGAITGLSSVCAGSTTTLGNATAGGTWTSSSPTIASIAAGTGVVSGISAGTATITYTLSTGCRTTTPFVVNPLPSAISGVPIVCQGSTTTLGSASPGGVWSSSSPVIATVSAAGVVTGISSGTTIISYTLSTGCATATIVTVYPTPPPITGSATVCLGTPGTLSNAMSGGTWVSSNVAIATVGATTGVVTGVSTGTTIISYFVSTGCFATRVVTVSATPVAITGPSTICLGLSGIYSNAVAGGVWSSSNVGVIVIDAAGIATTISSGTATISYAIGGCSAFMVVNVVPGPSAITGSSALCIGAGSALGNSVAGGTWSSSNPGIATVGATTGVVTGVSAGTANITYSLGTGCVATRIVTVTATASPIVGPSTLCISTVATYSNATTGGTWSSNIPSIVSIDGFTGSAMSVAYGTVTITYTLPGGCSATKGVLVAPIPAISGPSTICAGQSAPYTNDSIGTWSSNIPGIGSITSSTGILTGITAGTVIITFTSTSGCTATKVVTVNTITPAISGSTTVCVGGSITLSDPATGGTWSSSYTTVSVGAGTGVVTGLSIGTAVVSYVIPFGCPATTVVTVSNSASPISGPSAVCVGSVITLTDAAVGGSWISLSPGIATANSVTGEVMGVAPGTVTITYTLGSCYATKTITVNGAPASIMGSSSICLGSATTLTDATPGGAWSSSNTAIAPVNTAGVVTGVALGVATITYTISTGCKTTKNISVNAAPPAIGGPSTLCAGSEVVATNSVAGGTWSSSNPAVATIDAGGVLTGITNGTTIITYNVGGCIVTKTIVVGGIGTVNGSSTICAGSTATYTNTTAGGTWATSSAAVLTIDPISGIATGMGAGIAVISYTAGGCTATKTVTVSAGIATIIGNSNICLGTTATYTNINTGGVWSSSSPATASISAASGVMSGIAAGVVTITYSMGGCSVYKMVTINAAPTAISGPAGGCVGATITLSNAISGGTWSSSNTAVASIGAATGIANGMGAGVATITYAIGGCSTYRTLTINNSPAAISGGGSACVGSTISMTDATAGGTWSSSSTAVASVSAAGVVTGTGGGVATISYTVGTCAATKVVTINANPAAISGPGNMCTGSTITLTDAISGGTWLSGNPTLASVDAATGVVTGNLSGFVNIYYSVGGCQVSKAITINTTPAAISGSSSICGGATTTYSDVTAGGAWSSSNAGIATVSATGVVSGVGAGVVSISYTIGACSATKLLTVNAALAPITGSSTICLGQTATLSNAVAGGSWISSNTAVAPIGATSGVVSGLAVGMATIYYTAGGCSVTKAVTVSTAPAAIGGGSSLCSGASTALTEATAGGAWSSSDASVATVAATGVITGVAGGVVIISYSVGGACAAIKTITVNATPAAIAGSSTVCIGGTTTLSNIVTGGTWTSSTPARATVGATTGVVSGLSAGAVIIYYANGSCNVSKTMTVTGAPAAITGASSVCSGATITLADATAGGTWSSSNTAIASVSTTGVVSGTGAGVVTILYSSGSCSVQKVVTVNAAPAAISGGSIACIGSPITLTDVTAGGTWVSSNPGVASVSATGVVTGVATGFVLVYYTVSGCSASKTVSVNTMPAAITGAASVCAASSITLADATAGGTWSSSNTGIATISAGGVVNGVAAGGATISYTKAGCAATKSVTVNSCGLVGGKVSTGAGRGTSAIIPVVGMTIKLQDAATHSTVAETNTDAAGSYAFADVLYGNYVIYPEASGYATTPSDVIKLNNTSHKINNINFVQNSVDMTITPHSPAAAPAIATVQPTIGVYPNPSHGNLNIVWENQQAEMTNVLVTSIIGTEVYKGTLSINAGSGQAALDLTNLKAGVYLITIRSANVYYSSRLILQQ